MDSLRIQSALVSVYDKTGLEPILAKLNDLGVRLYASGGTADFIRSMDMMVEDLSGVTGFPSILDGRVKTLHPSIFGGILARRELPHHNEELEQHGIHTFDLVIVDLYPFEATVASGADEAAIIEKIDIGGIALIRAAAKNFAHVLCVPGVAHYPALGALLEAGGGTTTLAQRKQFAQAGFQTSSAYDTAIQRWFTGAGETPLRYGENPHQGARFVGSLPQAFTQLSGKELSYNNLLDVDAALRLIAEFDETACVIIKHTNPCGVALRPTVQAAWDAALAGDPVSAFGGIIALNRPVDLATAQHIHEQFYEVLLAPGFAPGAVELLAQKKNRILLQTTGAALPTEVVRSVVNGTLVQAYDAVAPDPTTWQVPTTRKPTATETADALLAETIAKHLKSNAIALVRQGQLIGGGMGQTSRVDALKQALQKAQERGHSVAGAVLASDGFFPFADSAELAHQAGIGVLLQPGGSIRDAEVVAACEAAGQCLILTGVRHFRH